MRKAAPSLIMTFAISLVAAPNAHAEIAWQTNLRTAHAQAQAEGKLLLLHFYSDHCTWCEKLEKGAFQEDLVGRTISEHYVPVKVHANSSPKLAEMFKVTKFPTDVIVNTDGKTLSHSVSPQDAERYVAMLKMTSLTVASSDSQPAATAVVSAPSVNHGDAAHMAADPQAVPGYAASPAAPHGSSMAHVAAPSSDSTASRAAAADHPSGGLVLPANAASGVTEAQLAGARRPSFEMPNLTNSLSHAEPAPSHSHVAAPAPAQRVETGALNATNSHSDPAHAHPSAVSTQKQAELAMQGFCPVTVIRDDKWVEGKPEYGVIHLGKLYLFSNEDNMQAFLSDPIPYTPVLNEIDAVVFFEERRIVPGKREWGLKDPIYNRMFFFADEASMNHFYNQYERYTKAAIEVMDKAVTEANPQS